MTVSPQRACTITNARENVEQESSQAPQVQTKPLTDKVINVEFEATFKVFTKAITCKDNREVVVS